jgi:hypothetical protein
MFSPLSLTRLGLSDGSDSDNHFWLSELTIPEEIPGINCSL